MVQLGIDVVCRYCFPLRAKFRQVDSRKFSAKTGSLFVAEMFKMEYRKKWIERDREASGPQWYSQEREPVIWGTWVA